MARLGDYIEQIRGISYKPDDVCNQGDLDAVAILRANNIQDDGLNFDDLVYIKSRKISQNQLIKKGDIVVCASSGSKHLVGKASIAKKDLEMSFGAFCKVVRAKNVLPEYLGYYFQSPTYRNLISNLASGANINNIRNEHIDEMCITVPNVEEQIEVSKKLAKVSFLVEQRKQQLSKLDELVKARFVELFGDVIINDKCWKQYYFSDIATSRLGKMLDAKQQTGKCSYPYLANFNVQWFRFDFDKLNVMDFNEGERKEFELIYGDLIVCEGGEIGRCAVWRNELQPCFFQKALHRVRCNQDIVKPDYLAYWFKYNCEYGGFSDIEGAKATIAHLTGEKLKCLRVTVPPIGLQNEFANFVEQIDKSKLSIQQSLEKLETLKKSLMQQYFG